MQNQVLALGSVLDLSTNPPVFSQPRPSPAGFLFDGGSASCFSVFRAFLSLTAVSLFNAAKVTKGHKKHKKQKKGLKKLKRREAKAGEWQALTELFLS